MTDLLGTVESYAKNLKVVTGRQAYFLDVTGSANNRELSVVSFTAVERMGDSYRVTIELTHPESLVRGDYLGRDATFRIDAADGREPRVFAGCITRFSKTKTTKDFSSYSIVVEAHIARLKLTRASRIYQQQSAPQIIEAILRRHGFTGNQFVFNFRREYPQHPLRFQYQISDWAYIHMLMEKEGIYSYIVPGKFGDQVVFADDVDHYLYAPVLRVPCREKAGLESGIEAVFALEMHADTVAQSYAVGDYNPDQAWERFKADANVARKDATTYGQPYVYGTHHLDQAGAQWEAQLRHEAAIARQVIYAGESNVLDLRPARVLQMDEDLPDAPNGQVIIEVTHSGARDQAYHNSYKAIPADRRFRLKLEEDTWPKIAGTLSARVTSPGSYEYAYLTQEGHYTVRFDLDFDEWNPGGESVPLRLAKPFAGKLQTGFHFPALDGDEAVIEFRDGNPDKPYISQFHHHSQAVDLITSEDRWLSRNVIRTQSNNKLRMEDWRGYESIKLSTEHSGKSQLNLGYLVDSKKQRRGEGFELRTSGWGAVRAGKGLLATTYDRPNAQGAQLDMQEAMQQLQASYAMMERFAQAAQKAQSEVADVKTMNEALQSQIKDLQQAVMVLSSASSIAMATPESILHSAGRNLTLTAGQNADVGVQGKLTMTAGELISLYAQQMGIQLIAGAGKVDVQAQNDAMALSALKDVTITSVDGRLVLSAAKEVWIGADGSYIKINGSRIENATSGDILEKCAAWDKQGPSSESLRGQLPNGLAPRALSLSLSASPATRNYIPKEVPYQVFADGVLVKKGVTDSTGQIPVDHQRSTKAYRIEMSNGVAYDIPVAQTYRGDAANGALANQGFHFHEEAGTVTEDRAVFRQTYQSMLHGKRED